MSEPNAASMRSDRPRRRWVGLGSVAAAVVTTLAIWFVASQTDFAALRAAFASADLSEAGWFFAALAVFYLLKAWRWRLLLWPLGRFGLGDLWPSMMAGFAFNNLLPAHLGEFVRLAAFSRQTGQPSGAVLSTIALERLFDVLAILGFLSYGLLAVREVDPMLRQSGLAFLTASVGLLIGAVAYVVATDWVIGLTRRLLAALRVPQTIASKVIGLAETGAGGLAALRSPSLLIGIAALSLAQWALNGAMIWLSLRAFGVEVSPAMAAVTLAAVAFGVTVPSTPGYFGVLQGAFVLALTALPEFDSISGRVVAASVVYHVAQWVPVTAIGLVGFRLAGMRLADVDRAETRASGGGQGAETNR